MPENAAVPSTEPVRLEAEILDNATYAIIATAPSGLITQFNRAAERMLGYTAEELVGRRSPGCFHDPDEVAARAAQLSIELDEQVEPGFDVFIRKARRGLPNEFEWTYVRKDGSRIPVHLSVSAMRDRAGRIRGYLGVARDISDQKRAQQALRESEAKLRSLFELSLIGIAQTDVHGRFVEFNDAFLRICGYAEDELRGLDYWDITPKSYETQEAEQLRLLAETGRYGPYEKEYRHKDGRLIPVRLNGVVFNGAEGQRYIWSIVEDITEQRAAEATLQQARLRAEAASLAKTNFLANISHELRTPLNGVIAIAKALAATELSPRQREMVDIVVNSGVTLEQILSEILELSKVEIGRVELKAEPFDLATEVRFAAEVMRGKAEEKGLTLEIGVAAAVEGLFVGDVVRIKQVVSNLVSNAVKFTERGRIVLTLDAGAEADPSGRTPIVISVIDSGIGIDPEVLPHLFERFTQADETITRRYGGTGLGLSICRGLANAMGGDIGALSTPGRGSVFTFRLALPRAHEAPRKSAPPVDVADLRRRMPLKVLVAEDHPVNRKVIELLLEPLGAALVMTANGAEAVEAFAGADFDVVLMDMQMPVMDGLSATRAIRVLEAERGRRPAPVVMLTANTGPSHRDDARAAGADAFLAKPVKPESLYACIEAALNPVDVDGPLRAFG